MQWLEKRKNFLIFLGSPGIGKTYFCAALLPWMIGKVNSFRVWKESQIFSRLKSLMDGSGDCSKELGYMLDDELMILDDLGSGAGTDWQKEIIFEVVDRRYESALPTVFTSNLTREELGDHFGMRVKSRLFAKENLIIECHNAKDLREDGL